MQPEPRSYPPQDSAKRSRPGDVSGARIAAVAPDSPAYDAGFEPGCYLTSVDGQPLRDVIDWRWLSGDEEMTVGYVDLDGDAGEVELWREPGEDWGFEFAGLVFDGVRQCRNACTFCFMRMLPAGMRPSLYLRDDDYRLSFLVGTFVTFTNLSPEDERRIVEQRISPLRVSLQASNPEVRARLIGRHAQHGIDVLDRLLAAGIEFHAQVVLVPGENDGDALAETLEWAYARPCILGVGIVPLGYTRFQDTFSRSFNDAAAARAVLETVRPFQERALAERGSAWAFPADEFYRNAYGAALLQNLPPASHYGDFGMFEDGIGIIRSTVDDWTAAWEGGVIAACADALRSRGLVARMVAGTAQREFLDPLIERAGIGDVFCPLYVENAFFGGNVDVTGLLVGEDIARAIANAVASCLGEPYPGHAEAPACRMGEAAAELARCAGSDSPRSRFAHSSKQPQRAPDAAPRGTYEGKPPSLSLFCIPRVVFNDDGLALDDMTLGDMEKAAGAKLHVVSCSPAAYFAEIAALIAG